MPGGDQAGAIILAMERWRRFGRLPVIAFACSAMVGCGRTAPPTPAGSPVPSAAAAPNRAAAPSAASPAAGTATTAEAGPRVVFLGDSLSAGYGLAEEDAFPAVVARRLAERGHPIHLVNAGVSGDTTAGGLARVDWVLRQKPAVLVVELGANDGLRGQPLAGIESNLRAIVERGKAAGARVLLTGMLIPPNYGKQYADGFAAIFPRLAQELDVPLVPFLLEGVAAEGQLNQADGIHPTAEGARRVAETVLPYVERLLPRPAARAAS